MTYVFDIDGTVCTISHGNYEQSKPYLIRIQAINKLYDEGHKIIFFTARGMVRTANNKAAAYALFYELTFNQLKEWGAKFHELHLGKLEADYFIDDKGVNADDFFEA